ncbi:hypothetical protein J41TS2_03150 [Bacillus sonorensis]|nr:hypothetical protein J41TS2_03150 [Bacillus sonorensis]
MLAMTVKPMLASITNLAPLTSTIEPKIICITAVIKIKMETDRFTIETET